MTAKKKFYGKDFQEKMEKLKGAHKGVELTTGNRLPHGYEIVKGAEKNKDYSKGKKKIVGLKKGYRLAHGYVATKGTKIKKYEDGGAIEYSANDFYKILKKGDKIVFSTGFFNDSIRDVVVEDVQKDENNNKIVRIEGVGFGAFVDNVHYTMEEFLRNKNIIEYNNKKIKISKEFATGGGVGEIQMELELIKRKYPNAKVSYYFAKNPNGKNYIVQAKENGKIVYSSYQKYAKGGGVGYEILDDLKYESFAKGGNMNNDEKLFCDFVKNRFLEKENPTKSEIKKAIQENMDSFSDEGKTIAKSVLSKI